jgi:hypothetical protein
VNLPHEGVVLQDTGRVIFDAEGALVFSPVDASTARPSKERRSSATFSPDRGSLAPSA